MSGRSRLTLADLTPGSLIAPKDDVVLYRDEEDTTESQLVTIPKYDSIVVLKAFQNAIANDHVNIVGFYEGRQVRTFVTPNRLSDCFFLVSRYEDCRDPNTYYGDVDSFDQDRVVRGGSGAEAQETDATA